MSQKLIKQHRLMNQTTNNFKNKSNKLFENIKKNWFLMKNLQAVQGEK